MYNENTQEQTKERKIITDEEAKEKALKKIMVGNLPLTIKKEELRELVDSFGRVISCEVINQKGYGFVTFLDHKDAAFAIYRLKDKLFQSNKLRADWSEEQRKPKPNARRKEDIKVKRVKKVPGSLRYLTPQNPATEQQQFTNGAGGVYVPKNQQQQNFTPPPQSSPLSLSQPPTHEETPVENVGGDHQNEGGRRNYGNNRRPHPNRGNYNNYDYNNNNNYVNNNFNNNPAPAYGGNNAGNYEDQKPDQDDQWAGQGNQRNQVYDQRSNQQRARGSRGGRRGGRGRRNRGGRGGPINDHQLYASNEQIPENNNDTLPQGGTVEEVVSNAPVAGLTPPPSGNVPQNTAPQNNYGRQKGGHKQQQQHKGGKQQQNVNRGGEVGDFVVTVANTKTDEVMFKVRLGDEQIDGLMAALQPFIPK